jgi:transposase
MPRSHQRYAPEYRQRIIELARAGRSLSELARQFEPIVETIRLWVKQAELDEGVRSDGLTTEERAELNRLRREKRVHLEERESDEARTMLAEIYDWFTEGFDLPDLKDAKALLDELSN